MPTERRTLVQLAGIAGVVLAIALIASISTPNLLRSREAADQARRYRTYHSGAGSAKGGDAAEMRRIVRTAVIEVTVESPNKSAEQLRDLVRAMEGEIAASESYASASDRTEVKMQALVPLARFDEFRRDLASIAESVDHEEITSQNATTSFEDLGSKLSNLTAQEQQYRTLLGRAASVKDTLAVADKLAEVHSEIDKARSEQSRLRRNSTLCSIAVTLNPKPTTSNWRETRQAWKELRADGLNYVDSMAGVLLRLPVYAAWTFTLFAGFAMLFRLASWMWKGWMRKTMGLGEAVATALDGPGEPQA